MPKATDFTPRLQAVYPTPAAADFPLVRWNYFRGRRHYTAYPAACSAPFEVTRYPDNILQVPGRTDGVLNFITLSVARMNG